MGHLRPDQRGSGLQGADHEVQRGVPERQDQLRVGPVRRGAEQVQDRGRGQVGAPDILRAEVAWVPEFASLGYLYALDGTDLLAEPTTSSPTPLSSNEFDGKTYGVPQVTDTLALMYNKKLFEKAGIDAAADDVGRGADAARR